VPPAQIPRDAFPGDLNATSRADPPVLPPRSWTAPPSRTSSAC
jgi:hypothetical protein